jgi:ATP-dependent RNA helicase DDX3X
MTPIQKNVIPIISPGNDVMACSQTGSGKTIAFLAPIVNKMLNDGPPNVDLENYPSAPIALILIPTRELAEQIYKEARKLLHQTGIQITKIYGGVPHDSQIRELREGTDILVATPGRLIDFLNSKLITLKAIKYLILDEADRILDLGFSDQLNSITFNYGNYSYIKDFYII